MTRAPMRLADPLTGLPTMACSELEPRGVLELANAATKFTLGYSDYTVFAPLSREPSSAARFFPMEIPDSG